MTPFLLLLYVLAQPQRPDRPPPPPKPGVMRPPAGKWWDRPEMVNRLNLTAGQRHKMNDIFQQSRVKLRELHDALDKGEGSLEPLMRANQVDDSKVLPLIDHIAQARAELERGEARLLLAFRHVLTAEQWDLLQSERRPPPPPHREQ